MVRQHQAPENQSKSSQKGNDREYYRESTAFSLQLRFKFGLPELVTGMIWFGMRIHLSPSALGRLVSALPEFRPIKAEES